MVLPTPPMPYSTSPAARGASSSAGQRRCARRRPTNSPASRDNSPAGTGAPGSPACSISVCGCGGRVHHGHRPGRGQHGQHRPLTEPGQLLVTGVRGVGELLLHGAPGLGHRGDHLGDLGVGEFFVDAGEHPGGVDVGDGGLGADHRAGAETDQRRGERRVTGRGGGIGVARGQRDHRRHPPGRDRLGHELRGVQHPAVPVRIFQLDRTRPPVPGQVQHVRGLGRQRRPDLAGGGEMHDPDPRLPLPGPAHRGQHVPQLPLIIQHPTAARQRRGDRHHHPQRPAQDRRPGPARIPQPVHRQQRMQRQRSTRPGQRQRLPRQRLQRPPHVDPEPDRHPAALRIGDHFTQRGGDSLRNERIGQQPPHRGRGGQHPRRQDISQIVTAHTGQPRPPGAQAAHRLGQRRRHPAMRPAHFQPGAAQPHLLIGHRQGQLGCPGPAAPGHRHLTEPGQQRRQVLGPRHPHRVPPPPIRAVIPGRHHPGHHLPGLARLPGQHRSPAHPPHHGARGDPAQRHLIVAGRPARPVTVSIQVRVGVLSIIEHRDAGDDDRRADVDFVAGGQARHRTRQRIGGHQHRQIMQRIGAFHPRLPDRAALQRIHRHRVAFAARAHRVQHMPGRHQHPGDHLKAGARRVAVSIEHPP